MLTPPLFGCIRGEVPIRKAPRIISRKRHAQNHANDETVKSFNFGNELEDEIDEGVVVQGGVMMRIVDEDEQEEHNHQLIISTHNSGDYRPRAVTIDVPSLCDSDGPYVENPLPGIADEVESYPCKFCPDRVFLTSICLEKHTKTYHNEKLDEVLEDISKIHDEWKRREFERSRRRERMNASRIRQHEVATALARGKIAPDEIDDFVATLPPASTAFDSGKDKQFDPCDICGIFINANHPSAMLNHMRAHTRNDELRCQLLCQFGPQFVDRVTCHDCQLVFLDEKKLQRHMEATHTRKRKYVCKWCGDVCLSMIELNNHKAYVHAVPASRTRCDFRRHNISEEDRLNDNPPLGAHGAYPKRSAGVELMNSTSTNKTFVVEPPCKTTCPVCNLIMVKPSLLIRHMLRVHNRDNFTAIIETKGMPSIKVTVDKGSLTWWCCNMTFHDRYQFIYHRRSAHQPSFAQDLGTGVVSSTTEVVDGGEVESTTLNDLHMVGGEQPTPSEDNVYLLLVADNATGSQDNKSELVQQIWSSSGPGSEVMEGGVQQIALSAEQFEQLRMQVDGDLSNVQVMFMEDQANSVTEANIPTVTSESSARALVPLDTLSSMSSVENAITEQRTASEDVTLGSTPPPTPVSDDRIS